MKRVTFAVAKAIKEAGYPQDIVKEEYLFDINGKPSTGFEQCEEFVRPTYMEVWRWLWREKSERIKIVTDIQGDCRAVCNDSEVTPKFDDPEEAIIAAIKYLVEHRLLK